jgi:hypothetical protein
MPPCRTLKPLALGQQPYGKFRTKSAGRIAALPERLLQLGQQLGHQAPSL